jgi:hypothetical protein
LKSLAVAPAIATFFASSEQKICSVKKGTYLCPSTYLQRKKSQLNGSLIHVNLLFAIAGSTRDSTLAACAHAMGAYISELQLGDPVNLPSGAYLLKIEVTGCAQPSIQKLVIIE